MAIKQIDMRLRYENKNYLELVAQVDEGAAIPLVKVVENGDLATLIPHIDKFCKEYFAGIMHTACEEMKRL